MDRARVLEVLEPAAAHGHDHPVADGSGQRAPGIVGQQDLSAVARSGEARGVMDVEPHVIPAVTGQTPASPCAGRCGVGRRASPDHASCATAALRRRAASTASDGSRKTANTPSPSCLTTVPPASSTVQIHQIVVARRTAAHASPDRDDASRVDPSISLKKNVTVPSGRAGRAGESHGHLDSHLGRP